MATSAHKAEWLVLSGSLLGIIVEIIVVAGWHIILKYYMLLHCPPRFHHLEVKDASRRINSALRICF
jgi:hypothetical protein